MNLKRASEGDEGSIWSNKAFSNGVLNIRRHALWAIRAQLLKASNAQHFLQSGPPWELRDGSDQLQAPCGALLGAASFTQDCARSSIHDKALNLMFGFVFFLKCVKVN